MAESTIVVLADVDVLATDFLSGLLDSHGFEAVVSPPVAVAVSEWVRKFSPDMCIVSLALRDDSTIRTVIALAAEYPATKFIVRTSDTSSESLRSALAGGVAGYLHKSQSPDSLLGSIKRVFDGEVVVEGPFSRPSAPEFDERSDFHRRVNALTPRQRECLVLISEGKNTAAMAAILGLSAMTVRTHVQAILTKLGVKSRVEAMSLVARHHLPE